MPTSRMNREEFFAKLAPLDEAGLKKALWNVYWRSPAQVRERIEGEIEPAAKARRQQAGPPDPLLVREQVRRFAALARSGAYMGGDRQVSPKERGRWRLTFRRLATDAQAALRAQDSGPAEEALAELVDLACETRSYDYFHTQDAMEAAQFVVSDAVGLLWGRILERQGFAAFADRAAPQLVRWESLYGWTRGGWGPLCTKETSLASVLTRMLSARDMWVSFAEHYLRALDEAALREPGKARGVMFGSGSGSGESWRRDERAQALAEWHRELLDRLDDPDAGHLLDKLVAHPAIGSAGGKRLQEQLAQQRGGQA
jgi:hypothetical protein